MGISSLGPSGDWGLAIMNELMGPIYCSWAGANGHLYMYILAAGTLPLDSEVMARKERSYGHQIAVERTG